LRNIITFSLMSQATTIFHFVESCNLTFLLTGHWKVDRQANSFPEAVMNLDELHCPAARLCFHTESGSHHWSLREFR
jgi:hypothetical protein